MTAIVEPQELTTHVLTHLSRRAKSRVREVLAQTGSDISPELVISGLEAPNLDSLKGDDLLPNLFMMALIARPYEYKRGSDAETVTFWPEDFISFFGDLADEAGLDLERFGRNLSSEKGEPAFIVGLAFTVLSEVEGIYTEHPGCLVPIRVPRWFLLAMSAAMIGIATGKAASLDPSLEFTDWAGEKERSYDLVAR